MLKRMGKSAIFGESGMRCTLYSCYWNGGGHCVCELEVAFLIPDSTSCPNYEEDRETEHSISPEMPDTLESER